MERNTPNAPVTCEFSILGDSSPPVVWPGFNTMKILSADRLFIFCKYQRRGQMNANSQKPDCVIVRLYLLFSINSPFEHNTILRYKRIYSIGAGQKRKKNQNIKPIDKFKVIYCQKAELHRIDSMIQRRLCRREKREFSFLLLKGQ